MTGGGAAGAPARSRAAGLAGAAGVGVVFLASGFAALLYQMVWQRVLFTIYGTNIESVTVVVTAFMLGLGLGSLTGGALSKDPTRPILLLFALVEMSIGVYGWFSLAIFDLVGRVTLSLTLAQVGLVTFLLVLVPTLLMGATLPLLVAHFVRRTGHVGRSVGLLYFVNTLGAAAGSFAAVVWVLGSFGLAGATRLAAGVNLTVGLAVLVAWLASGRPRGTAAAAGHPA